MAKFNSTGHRAQPPVAQATSVMRTSGGVTARPDGRTFEGALSWNKDAKTDLFLRATSSFHGGEKSFYESADQHDDTLRDLVRKVSLDDFAWLCRFVAWLRGPGNIRTAALMIAAEAVKANLDYRKTLGVDENFVNSVVPAYSSRKLVDSVLQRADEPGELLAYWTARYGRKVPKPIKRGIADAVRRLYNERSLLKYDTSSHAYRFADVLNLVHAAPDPDKYWQGDLFKYALDRRHSPGNTEIPTDLTMIRLNRDLRASDDMALWLSPTALNSAGVTWEDALSAVGSKVDKAKLWEAMIPSMGYMALLRNLRNFDETAVSDTVADQVIAKLQDPEQVARSRQLPFRFYSAYKNTESDRWSRALGRALDLCLPNIPELSGRTLVLVDTSASMNDPMSGKSTMRCVEGAALFGSALALKNPDSVNLVQFATNTAEFTVPKGGSVLKLTDTIMHAVGQVGHGTDMAGALRQRYSNHDRVILLSDMQAFGGWESSRVGQGVPAHTPIYCFNLSSYSQSPMPTGGAARFDLGGLTDATFALIPRLEAGLTGVWPWEIEKTA